MPDFKILDSKTGEELTITGPKAPTPREMAKLFAIHGKSALEKKFKGEMAAGMPAVPTQPAFPTPDQIAPVDASAVTGQKPVMPPPPVTNPFSGPLPAEPTKAVESEFVPEQDQGIMSQPGVSVKELLESAAPEAAKYAKDRLDNLSKSMPAVVGTAKGVGEAVDGVVQFITSTKGMAETVGMAVPYADVGIMGMWVKDMIEGGHLNYKEFQKARLEGRTEDAAKYLTMSFFSYLGAGHLGKTIPESRGVSKLTEKAEGFIPKAPEPRTGGALNIPAGAEPPEDVRRSRDILEMRPAVETTDGRKLVGEQGESHNQIIVRNNLKSTDVSNRVFDLYGETLNRKEAAEITNIDTTTQPGQLHSAELAEAQDALRLPSEEGVAPTEMIEEGGGAIGEPPAMEQMPRRVRRDIFNRIVAEESRAAEQARLAEEPAQPPAGEVAEVPPSVEPVATAEFVAEAPAVEDQTPREVPLGPVETAAAPAPVKPVAKPYTKGDLFSQGKRGYDLIDFLSDEIGTINYSHPELKGRWKPPGSGKFSATKGTPMDVAATAAFESGIYKGDPADIGEFAQAVSDAASARAGDRGAIALENKIAEESARKLELFDTHVDVARTDSTKERVPLALNEGDSFTLRGNEVKVKRVVPDEVGNPSSYYLDGGDIYGGDILVDFSRKLMMDKGSFKRAATEGAAETPLEAPSAAPSAEPVVAEPVVAGPSPRPRGMYEPKSPIEETPTIEEEAESAAAVGNPTEVIGEHDPRSAKNADMERQLREMGLNPGDYFKKLARQSFPEDWDRVVAMIESNPTTVAGPGYLDKLVERVRGEGEVLEREETLALLYRDIELKNEQNRKNIELKNTSDKVSREDISKQLDRVREQRLDVARALRASGTEQARAFNIRKLMAYEDFSYASMALDLENAQGGRSLSEDQKIEVQEVERREKESRKAYDELVEFSRQSLAEEEAKRVLVEEVLKKTQKELANRPKIDPRILEAAENFITKLEERGKKAESKLKEFFSRTNVGLDPTILIPLAEWGAAKIARFSWDSAKFSAKVLEEFGEDAKSYIQEAFVKANEMINSGAEELGNFAPGVKKEIRKKEKGPAAVLDDIRDKFDEGVFDISMDVKKIAKMFVQGGTSDVETLISQVQEVMKEVNPDMTRLDTLEAISGYGQYRKLSKEEVDIRWADLRTQALLLTKIETLEKQLAATKTGEVPGLKPTGFERYEMTPLQRKLTAQLDELKKKVKVVVVSKEKQLKSYLDTRKSYYKNLRDRKKDELATGKRWIKEKTTPPTDAELDQLKAEIKALNEILEDVFEPQNREQRIRKQLENLDYLIVERQRKIAAGDFSAAPKPEKLSTPELEALRNEAAGLQKVIEKGRRAGKAGEVAARRKQKQLENIQKEISVLEEKLKTGNIQPEARVAKPVDPEIAAWKAKRNLLQDEIIKQRNAQKVRLSAEEKAYRSYKKRLEKQNAWLMEKMKAGDYSKPNKRKADFDSRLEKLKAQNELIKDQWMRGVETARIKELAGLDHATYWFNKILRFNILSNPRTKGRLALAAGLRIGGVVARDIAFAPFSRLPFIKKVVERSPLEGKRVLKADVIAMYRASQNMRKDMAQKWKYGKSDLQLSFGKKAYAPKHWLDFFGTVDDIIKTPVERFAFHRAEYLLTEYYMRQRDSAGNFIDVAEPNMRLRINMEAMQYANQILFKQENWAVSSYRMLVENLKKKKSAESGEVRLDTRVYAAALQTAYPIVKIPVNMFAELLETSFAGAYGISRGGVLLGKVVRKGFENAKPAEQDLILRNFKNGAIGAVLFTVGYANYKQFGGMYRAGQKKKEDRGKLKPGDVQVFDITIPGSMIHSKDMGAMNIGATVAQIQSEPLKRHQQDQTGIVEAIAIASVSMAEENPLYGETAKAIKAFELKKTDVFLAELMAQSYIPAAFNELARRSDLDLQGKPVKREFTGLMRALTPFAKRIPYVIKLIPPKEEKVPLPKIPGMPRVPKK
jgi:hypothetical protein